MTYQAMAQALRNEIFAGKLRPGQSLPSRLELQRRFRTTPITIQRAVDRLVEHGYLVTEPRVGTFVAKHPPHLTHYALAFPFQPSHLRSQFYNALHLEAKKLQSRARRITAFYDIEEHVDVEDYQRLLGFVREHRVAGVIFAHHPHALFGSPLLELPDMPRVAVMLPVPDAKFPTVYPALDQFVPRALDRLAALGRRRVAFLSLMTDRSPADVLTGLRALATARGMVTHPHWVQATHPERVMWAEQIIRGLFHPHQTERPDALVITDDNLVPVATAALQALNVRVPEDVTVVVETNFPWPTSSAVPVIRLGFAVGQVLGACLARIDEQRRGETPPAHTAIPAVFEAESAAVKSRDEVFA